MALIYVDGVAYNTDQVRELIRERHRLTSELSLLKRTLTLRSAALNRTSEALETLRSLSKPNP